MKIRIVFDKEQKKICCCCCCSIDGGEGGLEVLLDDLDVIGRIEADPTVLATLAPTLFVLVFKFFESVTWKIEKKSFNFNKHTA